jgi:hypothetical protein
LRASWTVMVAASAALPTATQHVIKADVRVRQIVIAGSLRQDQFVLRGQAQAIDITAMRNDDLTFRREQLAAVDPISIHHERSCCGRGISGLLSSVSYIVSRTCGHF